MQIVNQRRIAGIKSRIGINLCGLLIEVTRAYISVAAYWLALSVTPQYKSHFGMYLQSRYTE